MVPWYGPGNRGVHVQRFRRLLRKSPVITRSSGHPAAKSGLLQSQGELVDNLHCIRPETGQVIAYRNRKPVPKTSLAL